MTSHSYVVHGLWLVFLVVRTITMGAGEGGIGHMFRVLWDSRFMQANNRNIKIYYFVMVNYPEVQFDDHNNYEEETENVNY